MLTCPRCTRPTPDGVCYVCESLRIRPGEMECKRCGYLWIPRVAEPKCCPACKSRLWRESR